MGVQSDAIVARMERELETIVKFITLGIDRRLRRNPRAGGTPVDTGHARANWIPSVSSPHTAIVQGDSAHGAGVAAVLAYRLEAGPAWVTNNVPYILVLNDGHSSQAPAGFIERAIDETLDEAREKFGIAIDVTAGTPKQLDAAISEGFASAYSPFADD